MTRPSSLVGLRPPPSLSARRLSQAASASGAKAKIPGDSLVGRELLTRFDDLNQLVWLVEKHIIRDRPRGLAGVSRRVDNWIWSKNARNASATSHPLPRPKWRCALQSHAGHEHHGYSAADGRNKGIDQPGQCLHPYRRGR
jgi:hypothetical protein